MRDRSRPLLLPTAFAVGLLFTSCQTGVVELRGSVGDVEVSTDGLPNPEPVSGELASLLIAGGPSGNRGGDRLGVGILADFYRTNDDLATLTNSEVEAWSLFPHLNLPVSDSSFGLGMQIGLVYQSFTRGSVDFSNFGFGFGLSPELHLLGDDGLDVFLFGKGHGDIGLLATIDTSSDSYDSYGFGYRYEAGVGCRLDNFVVRFGYMGQVLNFSEGDSYDFTQTYPGTDFSYSGGFMSIGVFW